MKYDKDPKYLTIKKQGFDGCKCLILNKSKCTIVLNYLAIRSRELLKP